MQIDNAHKLMTTAITMPLKNDTCTDDEHKLFLAEGGCLLLELRLLSAALDARFVQISSKSDNFPSLILVGNVISSLASSSGCAMWNIV